MNLTEFDKYEQRCLIIKNLIEKHYNNHTFKFYYNTDNRLYNILINGTTNISILGDNTWQDIKRHIDKKLNYKNNSECGICFETIKKNVTCPKCSQNLCAECYINIIRKGKGIFTCPFCKYKFGEKMELFDLALAIVSIKEMLGDYTDDLD